MFLKVEQKHIKIDYWCIYIIFFLPCEYDDEQDNKYTVKSLAGDACHTRNLELQAWGRED
mgnify:CR=1 FL=1